MAHLTTWTFDADGNGAWYTLEHRIPFEARAFGDFGGGTLTFQFSANGGNNPVAVSGVSLSADGTSGALGGVPNDKFRPVLSGATDPDITVLLDETVTKA